jgi:hypothetical protein
LPDFHRYLDNRQRRKLTPGTPPEAQNLQAQAPTRFIGAAAKNTALAARRRCGPAVAEAPSQAAADNVS